ncbi:MAG: pirin family protein [Myxococcales bacterium]|nr:pirin family protein [Myxococcales bacterium]MCB9641776.1 pirin family protein [Myxococcales bacterium]
MSQSPVLRVYPLGFPWKTMDPFLFCVYHKDDYPEGNEEMGPNASLRGRDIGADFAGKDGWSMYHGDTIPGFPQHPHYGFETITIGRAGFVDHSDSLGATARFGEGDVQWMTAGKGVVHSEMFPLVHQDKPNPTELFQIWLNLPREDKSKDPYFTMFWRDQVPEVQYVDDAGHRTVVRVIAGSLDGAKPPSPPPSSWASREASGIAIWTLKMEPHATWTLPPAAAEVHRNLYFFAGESLMLDDKKVAKGGIEVRPEASIKLTNGDKAAEILMLQGKPIGEPVFQHGPFVVNEPEEIRRVVVDFQRTGFGGWPWDSNGPAHAREKGRFAIHADKREEHPNE